MSRKHAQSQVANWRTETEIGIYAEENKTHFPLPTVWPLKKKKTWLEGLGELPAAEEAGKN